MEALPTVLVVAYRTVEDCLEVSMDVAEGVGALHFATVKFSNVSPGIPSGCNLVYVGKVNEPIYGHIYIARCDYRPSAKDVCAMIGEIASRHPKDFAILVIQAPGFHPPEVKEEEPGGEV